MSKPFIWVSAFPKSGNTWVRLFLSAYINGGTVNINDLPRRTSNSDLMPYYYHSLSPVPVKELTTYGVLCLRNAVLQHVCHLGGSWPIFLKTHHANMCMNEFRLIPEIVTESAVYIIRDPRDVAVSLSKHNDESIDKVIEDMGQINCALHSKVEHESSLFHLISSWSNHVDTWMQAEFPCEAFTYEKLVLEPEDGFKRLLDFLNFSFDQKVFYDSLEATKFESLKGQEDEKGFREAANGSFFNQGQVGNWKNVLTTKQADKIVEDHGHVMERLGYL